MEPTIKAEHNDIKSQSAKQSEHLKSDERLGAAATIADICAAITKLVTTVSDAGCAETRPQADLSDVTEGDADALWENVREFAAQLSRARSSSLDDINGKISIWRHLAPEQSEDTNYQTMDETLLHSIIDDVERLRTLRAV